MFKLTIECKNVSELSEVVAKIGGKAEQGVIETPAAPKNEAPKSQVDESSELTPKQKLTAEAEAMGIEVKSRDTMSDIEDKIKAHKNGHETKSAAQAQAQVNNVGQSPFPDTPAIPQNQNVAQAQPNVQAQVPNQGQHVQVNAQAFDRNATLQGIVGRLAKCSEAGIPEDQLAPEIQKAVQSVGGQGNQRLSALPDNLLSQAAPIIIEVLDAKIRGAQTSSFV
jgi:hypothetical protein